MRVKYIFFLLIPFLNFSQNKSDWFFGAEAGLNTITSYTWAIVIDPANPLSSGTRTPGFNISTGTIAATTTTASPAASVRFGNCQGEYTIQCTANNACGSTLVYENHVTVSSECSESPCYIGSTILSKSFLRQNPVKEQTLKLINLNAEIENTDTNTTETSNFAEPVCPTCRTSYPVPYNGNKTAQTSSNNLPQIRIFDFAGKQVYENTIITKEEEYDLENLNLKPDNYILHVIQGNNIHKEIIIIK